MTLKEHDTNAAKRFKQTKLTPRTVKKTIKILPERLYETSIIRAKKLIQKAASPYRRLGDEYYIFETDSEIFFGESVWGKQLYDFLELQEIEQQPVRVRFMRTRHEKRRYYICLAEAVGRTTTE